MSLRIEDLGPVLKGDPRRVLLRPHLMSGSKQARNLVSRVLAMQESDVDRELERMLRGFSQRHQNFKQFLKDRFEAHRSLLSTDLVLSEKRQLLMGACFSSEYSLEYAALFNPSMVPHPDPSGVSEGELKIILSLRATGEGHISSITFRTGRLDRCGQLRIDPPGVQVVEPALEENPVYQRELFGRKLYELGLSTTFTRQVVQALDEEFTLKQLRYTLGRERWRRRDLAHDVEEERRVDDKILALALSNYEVNFPEERDLSERAIFPVTPSQRNGIEDARFVRFEDGTYYATYTAYDGRLILPQLLETRDFTHFKFITLNGPAVRNKGMALFPRKIGGLYATLGRQDGEAMHLMLSDNIHFWYESRVILRPRHAWEMVQLGNCGSPIETEAGWLVLTHGVGPMREYSIGAVLLDREDPCRVLGRLRRPLLQPLESERHGYVPNVVYSCGALVHQGWLIVPYGVCDSFTRFARVRLDRLLNAMT